jgi:hypothetical protein
MIQYARGRIKLMDIPARYQNEKLGDISEIVLDKSGKVDGVVVGVGGA